ncbi:protein dipZ [Mycobacterium avium MAV_120709_2344]|nr:protein dipZ [Mycobacterium avium MAV_120709_2344]
MATEPRRDASSWTGADHRPDRVPRRPDHRDLAVHPAGAAGDTAVRHGRRPARRGLRGAALPGDRGPGVQLQRGHADRLGAADGAAPAPGCDPVDRPGGADRHRAGTDLPAAAATDRATVRLPAAAPKSARRRRFRPGPDVGRAVRAVRRTGARRDRGGRRHLLDRPRRAGVDRDVRRRKRAAAAGLRAGRPARRPAGRGVPPPAAGDTGRRRDRDDRAGRRAGVQPARDAAARRPGLHHRDAEPVGRQRPSAQSEPPRAAADPGRRAAAEPGRRHRRRGAVRLFRQVGGAAAVRAGARAHRDHRVAQHPGRQTARPGGGARQGDPDRLLGLLVHQLPARHPTRNRLVRPVSRQRIPGHRGAHPGIRLRTGPGQRGQRRGRPAHRLSDRPGQRLRDVEQLPEPVLAGRVPDRRDRAGAAHQVRRRRLRRHRTADPRTAHRRPSRRAATRPGEHRRHHTAVQAHPRDLPGRGQGRKLRRHRRLPVGHRDAELSGHPGRGQVRAARALDAGRPGRHRGRRRLRGPAELHRQRRLRRRRRHRHPDRDPGRDDHHDADRRAPTLHRIVADDSAHRDQLDMRVSPGLQVFSFTFG